jgi:hypothetical protein
MNEPQNLKDHKISKRTQITKEPQISKYTQNTNKHQILKEGKFPMTPKLQINRKF